MDGVLKQPRDVPMTYEYTKVLEWDFGFKTSTNLRMRFYDLRVGQRVLHE